MDDMNIKRKNIILIVVVCIIGAIMLSFGVKTMIDYSSKGKEYNEEKPYGAEYNADDGCDTDHYFVVTNGTPSCEACPDGKFSAGGTATSCYSKATTPVCKTNLIYTGNVQTLVAEDSSYILNGEKVTNAGNHTVTVKLASGYLWEDGSSADKTLNCSIAKAKASSVSFTGNTSKIYDGNPLVPTVKVMFNNNEVSTGIIVTYYNGEGCSNEKIVGAPIEVGTYSATVQLASVNFLPNTDDEIKNTCTKLSILKSALTVTCSPNIVDLNGTGKCTAKYGGESIDANVGTLSFDGPDGLNIDATTGTYTAKAIGKHKVSAILTYKSGAKISGIGYVEVVSNSSLDLICSDSVLEKSGTTECITKFNGEKVTSTYSSSDEKILKIDSSGKVTAIENGTADVIAKYEYNGKEYTDKFTIGVGTTDYNISVSKSKIYLAKDEDKVILDVNVYDNEGKTIHDLELEIQSENQYVKVETTTTNYSGEYYPLVITSVGKGDAEEKNTVMENVKVCIKGTDKCDDVEVHIHCSKWVEKNATLVINGSWSKDKAHFNEEVCDYVDYSKGNGCEQVGENIYKCTKYYNRCCGSSDITSGDNEKEACYKNKTTGKYVWGKYKSDSNYELKSSISSSDACDKLNVQDTPTPEEDACYKNKTTGKYEWGKYKSDSNYELKSDINNPDACSGLNDAEGFGPGNEACYKDANGNYEWSSTPSAGFEIVESIKDEKQCKLSDKAACYKDNKGRYIWGDYSGDNSYVIDENIKSEEKCINPDACYKDQKGNFVWGNFIYDESYSLVEGVDTQSKCGQQVNVPSTAARISSIIYIAISVMLAFGSCVIYYVYNKKRINQ